MADAGSPDSVQTLRQGQDGSSLERALAELGAELAQIRREEADHPLRRSRRERFARVDAAERFAGYYGACGCRPKVDGCTHGDFDVYLAFPAGL